MVVESVPGAPEEIFSYQYNVVYQIRKSDVRSVIGTHDRLPEGETNTMEGMWSSSCFHKFHTPVF